MLNWIEYCHYNMGSALITYNSVLVSHNCYYINMSTVIWMWNLSQLLHLLYSICILCCSCEYPERCHTCDGIYNWPLKDRCSLNHHYRIRSILLEVVSIAIETIAIFVNKRKYELELSTSHHSVLWHDLLYYWFYVIPWLLLTWLLLTLAILTLCLSGHRLHIQSLPR